MRVSQKQNTAPTTDRPSHKTISTFANRTYKMVSAIKHFFQRIFHGMAQIAHRIFHKAHAAQQVPPKEIYADKHKLLLSKNEVRESEYHWHLNLSLLRNAERSTNDPETLQKLRFLEANYLKKAAPPMMEWMLELEKHVEKRFQLSPFADATYHREGFRQQIQLGTNIVNKKLALEHESPLVLTDTIDFAHFLPLRYTVVHETTPESITPIEATCIDHFASLSNPQDGLTAPLRSGILFDVTERFQELIKTGKDRHKEAQFRTEFASFKREVEALIEKTSQELHTRYPSLSEDQLRHFLHKNITCICRVQLGTVAGMKVLPLFADLSKNRLKDEHPALLSFIDETGIYVNALTMRRYFLEERTKAKDTEYGVRASKPQQMMARYFPEKDTLMKMNLWKTLSKEIDSPKRKNVPYIQILGRSTLQMLKGLIEEISEEQWEKLNADPTTCQVIQNSLFRIANHLASAHFHIDSFEKFSQDIELVFAEMAAILEFASPFKLEDFPEIYKQSIQRAIPKELLSHVQIGLGKSAVNTFAGINAAIFATNPNPVRAHSPAFYYEQADLMGLENSVKAIVDNPAAKKVDLYCSQFHANVQPQKGYTTYQTQDIAADIRQLLLTKPETDHLTVAIDYTIDLVNSQKLHDLLDSFKDEIHSGRLNFILFKSGQKTDMFGQDNYFGAPFFIINNGQKYWEQFNTLLANPVHKTDSLSTQWFCLSNKYATDAMEAYRRIIFDNSRAIIEQMPESLRPHPKDPDQRVYVCSVDPETEISFIDVKIQGPDHRAQCYAMMKRLLQECEKKGVKVHIKQSWGFCHINAVGPFDERDVSTIRINPSINPEENAVVIEFLQKQAS